MYYIRAVTTKAVRHLASAARLVWRSNITPRSHFTGARIPGRGEFCQGRNRRSYLDVPLQIYTSINTDASNLVTPVTPECRSSDNRQLLKKYPWYAAIQLEFISAMHSLCPLLSWALFIFESETHWLRKSFEGHPGYCSINQSCSQKTLLNSLRTRASLARVLL